MMTDHTASADPFGEITDQFVDDFREGKHPSVDEYAQRFPERAEEIREILPALVMMEKAKSDEDDAGNHLGDAADEVTDQPQFDQLGDFHIIREVGRGGMGVVYEAEQESLGRRVALKVLPKQMLLDPKQKKRFSREARAAAQLHHTNIVPVFGVGEHEGLQYYAMQFIHGLGLDEVLHELKQMRSGQLPLTAESPTPTAKREAQVRQDVSAVAVAQSLLTGEFAPTLLFEGDARGQDSGAGIQDSGGSAEGESGSDGTTATDKHQESSALKDTATLRLSDTFAFSGSVNLPGQSSDGSKSKSSKSSYWQSVARIGIQVAEGLEHASAIDSPTCREFSIDFNSLWS